jgi:hypothetical protein
MIKMVNIFILQKDKAQEKYGAITVRAMYDKSNRKILVEGQYTLKGYE